MLRVGDYKISLDVKEEGSNVDFISHAHSDHISAARSSKNILASNETVELMKIAYNIDTDVRRIDMPNSMRIIDSGHMLGAKQLVIETDGEKVVYTGDFQLERSLAAPKIEIENADTLIMDSTYPYGDLAFGNKYEEELKMQRWTNMSYGNGIVLFGAYVMGKAQEIIRILNDVGIVPVVNRKIAAISNMYKRCGIGLEYLSMYENVDECEEALRHNFVGITDNNSLKRIPNKLSEVHEKRVYTAVATGFSRMFSFNTDAQFCISDHADLKQSMEYIEASGAKKILTYGNGKERFAKEIARNGLKAYPFIE